MRRSLVATAVAVVLVLGASAPARAQARGSAGGERHPDDVELDFVPIVGGDSDIGFGGGAVGAVTRFAPAGVSGAPADEPWAWRLEGSTFVTFRVSSGVDVPYQDHWLLLTLPDLFDGRLRVTVRGAFTREANVRYFGLGNASPAPSDETSPLYEYTRAHPELEAHARASLGGHMFATTGGSFTLNWFDVPPDGPLALDMRSGSPEVRSLLGQARTSGVAIVDESVSWDDRDDEVVPRRGNWDELTLRVSPALGSAVPYAFGEVLAVARTYVPVSPRVVIAARGVVDALFGTPPFYQLAQYDDTYAIGGTAGVRGVPGERYYGKIKVFGNLEIRTDVARFRALHKPWGIAAVTFLDAGRLWADWSAQPALDGTALGLKWGTGVGIRLQQGRAFVVRADLAWSPDARPIGGYFAAGEQF